MPIINASFFLCGALCYLHSFNDENFEENNFLIEHNKAKCLANRFFKDDALSKPTYC